MFTIYGMAKEQADRQYKKCDRCDGRTPCPESTCLWAACLANGGEGRTYCTAPATDREARVTRYGM